MKLAAEYPKPATFLFLVMLFGKFDTPICAPAAPIPGLGILSLYIGLGLFI